jgi:hypothetical protein
MAEDQKSIDGIIEKLALISDASSQLFPDGRIAMVFELNEPDFKKVQNNFRDVDRNHKQFKIDISGIEFIFLLDELLSGEKDKSE